MTEEIRFVPAGSFTLDAFADIFTRSFEDYFYPGAATAEILARRLRAENLDLQHSVVMLVGGEPAGQALLGLRHERAWCGGFGVLAAFRGRGLSHQLCAELLARARGAGARTLSLEVLTRNIRAIGTYTRAGLRPVRDLLVLEWRAAAEDQEKEPASASGRVVECPAAPLLDRFPALHPAPAAWQRDLPALLVRGGMSGLAIAPCEAPTAYLLYQPAPDGSARIEDLGASAPADALALLSALQTRHARIISVNEPADSPTTAAFALAGFAEVDRQHELAIALGEY